MPSGEGLFYVAVNNREGFFLNTAPDYNNIAIGALPRLYAISILFVTTVRFLIFSRNGHISTVVVLAPIKIRSPEETNEAAFSPILIFFPGF